MDAIFSEASTSLRGFPPVRGPVLAFDILLSQFRHLEDPFGVFLCGVWPNPFGGSRWPVHALRGRSDDRKVSRRINIVAFRIWMVYRSIQSLLRSSVPGGQIVELRGGVDHWMNPRISQVKRLIGGQFTVSDRPAVIYELVTSHRDLLLSRDRFWNNSYYFGNPIIPIVYDLT